MKLRFVLSLALLVSALSALSWADSNGTLGGVLNSESISLGAGPFNHGAPIPSGDNSVVNPVFVGGFTANRVRFSGTLTKVAAATFASEADIRIQLGAFTFNWQNPGPASSAFTVLPYDSTQTIAGIDPAGLWTVTFFDSFNDGAGADATSSGVTMEFQNVQPNSDTNGAWNLGTLDAINSYSRVGEFAVGGVHDRYTFSLGSSATVSFGTDFQNVLLNQTVDTEVGLFDAATGNIITNAFDDDSGPGLYSQVNNVLLGPGTYTIVVGAFNTNFSNTSTLANLTFGSLTGDYVLNINVVPEPTTLGALAGLGVLGLAFGSRRRRV